MAGLDDVPDDWLSQRARRAPLRPPLVELHLVHGPYGPLNVLHAHETFVKRQVVAHSVLTTKQRQINNASWYESAIDCIEIVSAGMTFCCMPRSYLLLPSYEEQRQTSKGHQVTETEIEIAESNSF